MGGQTWKCPRGDSETGDFVIPFLRHDVKEGVVVNHELQEVNGVLSVNLIQFVVTPPTGGLKFFVKKPDL